MLSLIGSARFLTLSTPMYRHLIPTSELSLSVAPLNILTFASVTVLGDRKKVVRGKAAPIRDFRTPDTRRRLRSANRNVRLRRQSKEIVTLNLTRRNALLTAAYAGAAFGLPRPVSFIEAALALKGPEAGKASDRSSSVRSRASS
jgi:hypothetical protein